MNGASGRRYQIVLVSQYTPPITTHPVTFIYMKSNYSVTVDCTGYCVFRHLNMGTYCLLFSYNYCIPCIIITRIARDGACR